MCVPKYGLRGPDGTAAGLCVQICAKSPVLFGVYLMLSCFSSHLSLEILSPFLIRSHHSLQAEVLQIMTVLLGPGGSCLHRTCRFLSMSQLVSKSSSSSPKGLMSCSATCMWRAHSKGQGHAHPFPCRRKAHGAESRTTLKGDVPWIWSNAVSPKKRWVKTRTFPVIRRHWCTQELPCARCRPRTTLCR